MKIFKLEYEIIDIKDKKWLASVLAKDADDAIQFTIKVVGKPINLLTVEYVCDVNAIADSIIHKVLDVYGLSAKNEEEEAPIRGANVEPLNLNGESEVVKERRKPGPKPKPALIDREAVALKKV